MIYIGFAAHFGGHRRSILKQGHSTMTYLEVVFRYGDAPGERELQASIAYARSMAYSE